jgi:RHS repeat-associated protein
LEQDNLLFKATIVSTADYTPFGVQLDERTESTETYRYGYQGSEKDDEVKGEGNSYTTEFRLLDPRLGRWLSIDPLAAQFPWQSPYVSMDNNPILLNDVLGDCPDCPKESQQGDIHTSSKVGPFDSPGGHMVSGTDGTGWIVFGTQTNLESITWINTGESGWLAAGFQTKSGERFAWDIEKNWYVNKDGKEFDDHASFDATKAVAGAITAFAQMAIDYVKEGDGLKSFKEAYYAHGGSVAEFTWDGIKHFGNELTAGGHRGMMAWGGLYAGFLSGGPAFGIGATEYGLGSGLLGSMPKNLIPGFRTGLGFSKELNYFSYVAYLQFGVEAKMAQRMIAGPFVQINHNLGKLISGQRPQLLYSYSKGAYYGRVMQNHAMGSGISLMGYSGTTSFGLGFGRSSLGGSRTTTFRLGL